LKRFTLQVDESPVTTDLVLIGGGHSHLFVLKQPGLRITLVTPDLPSLVRYVARFCRRALPIKQKIVCSSCNKWVMRMHKSSVEFAQRLKLERAFG
jgi:hypothetical protein